MAESKVNCSRQDMSGIEYGQLLSVGSEWQRVRSIAPGRIGVAKSKVNCSR